MTRTTRNLLPLGFAIDAADHQPLHVQIREQLRRAILEHRLQPGARLPSSRLIADDLACARGTVLLALDQLTAEGYLEARPGAGTHVAVDLPDELLATASRLRPDMDAPAPAAPTLSRRAQALLERTVARRSSVHQPRAAAPGLSDSGAFVLGRPALDAFAFKLWARLLEAEWRDPDSGAADPRHPFGSDRLRQAIAAYLGSARSFTCDPAAIVVTSGVRQALTLLARLLLDPGEAAWVEEPGFPGVLDALAASGIRPVPVPVDEHGLPLEEAMRLEPAARLVVVAPAHHYPLGVTMSLPRRLALLNWARTHDGWIVEDDYDGEYRYAGRPLAPLRALDRAGRVAYVGSFSKVLFPSLRLGYLVLPQALVPAAEALLIASGPSTTALGQAALARFIAEGHFAAHLRNTRRLYAERQAALVEAGQRHLKDILDLPADPAGMHLTARPAHGRPFDDEAAARRAAAHGLAVTPLSRSYASTSGGAAQGLLLGYASLTPGTIRSATLALAKALS